MIFWRSWVITEAVTAITGIARVPGVRPQVVQRLDPVHPRQLDIHEDEGGRRRLGQPDPLLRGVGLDRLVAVELEDVTSSLRFFSLSSTIRISSPAMVARGV